MCPSGVQVCGGSAVVMLMAGAGGTPPVLTQHGACCACSLGPPSLPSLSQGGEGSRAFRASSPGPIPSPEGLGAGGLLPAHSAAPRLALGKQQRVGGCRGHAMKSVS